ncbi:MAG TPA: NADP-dependent oxidoreductase [Solirubrobacteraceae bacterium]|nr:NADP-dependent oxidoreductase [Solirubrobacteraceae bacterium]
MPRAVRFDHYGDVDVLDVVDVERPTPGRDQVLVRVKAAGINPGEASIRRGLLHERWPATFPSGEGSDLAGVVDEAGPGVEQFSAGDEVIGWTDERGSQAELVIVPVGQLVLKPAGVSWEAAGALFVAGVTAYAAVHAVGVTHGDTVVVSGAAGGVGSIAVQLAVEAGASNVIGLASESHHQWLRDHGVTPVAYGDGAAERIREAAGASVDAFVDTYGGGYVQLAVEDLGVAPDRVDTIIDWEAAGKYGVKTEGSLAGSSPEVLGALAKLIDQGKLEIPIANAYPLDRVRDAYTELERRHTLGKIVLRP